MKDMNIINLLDSDYSIDELLLREFDAKQVFGSSAPDMNFTPNYKAVTNGEAHNKQISTIGSESEKPVQVEAVNGAANNQASIVKHEEKEQVSTVSESEKPVLVDENYVSSRRTTKKDQIQKKTLRETAWCLNEIENFKLENPSVIKGADNQLENVQAQGNNNRPRERKICTIF